ncbi:MAG: Mur ligase family protein [Woeseiaceae bacterium]|nr:Mur ligase family protein [Woeseiaceae bacterium]
MRFLDARRLTGPNLLFDVPAAVLDIECDEGDVDRIPAVWEKHVKTVTDALGWAAPEFNWTRLTGGLSLAFTVEIDQLYAASEINEWSFEAIAAELGGEALPDVAEAIERIGNEAKEEANPGLLDLKAAAQRHEVTLLWDDDDVSLGMGIRSDVWPVRELPDDVDWGRYGDVPIGLVTGTNGKTTTVRVASHILRGTHKGVGVSCTDWIAVNDTVIDRDDWSGPGGARQVLRNPDVDVAVLESARGGLLRRGLGVDQAAAAAITNIAEDHLGDFGSANMRELLNIKWIVSRAVADRGTLVLNADDPLLCKKAVEFDGRISWFSLNASNERIEQSLASGGTAFILSGDVLCMRNGDTQTDICKTFEIPIAMGGAARHNVANALAAAALTYHLGVDLEDIAVGLKSVEQDDNPGRCNLYELNGRKILVDFAHNPQAMHALFDMARAIPARRRVLCFGQAGDRPDPLIERMTRDAFAIGLDRVVVSELTKYHRGRQHGEVFAVIQRTLKDQGLADEDIRHFEKELESFDHALEWAGEGDLVIMLALGGAAPIVERLRELGLH